jgi:hypothetical protein
MSHSIFLVLFVHRLYGLFAVDCASYVRIPCVMIVLQKQGAQGLFSQNRHLEQGKDYFRNRNGHMDCGQRNLHLW